ncbi:LysR family transcriptional regulator [Nocardiopsis exhalans]|uniref:LysR family transcriptional regulator n=1 Tax=Nocardiopsis exhalans TaxID=163604 RepID=A0ABY5D5T2_9ACTN|nr:LysR family transcriptional regulator [Nocardiopsis exhalans]USY18506.1 LysR family transcriptional regulator [Nocardiopsis exhalans]
MTPTQLRAFSAVARLGSVKRAARELDVSEAAVSLHIGKLRKLFGDRLFSRTGAGLAFTPGGLRLAGRATELLGLQDRTLREVSQAGTGTRLLRIASSSLFVEYAAPGLIELFVGRADDLDVELSVHSPSRFEELLSDRAVDVAIGPAREQTEPAGSARVTSQSILRYQLLTVVGPGHPLASGRTAPERLREQTWLLGPSALDHTGLVPAVLRRFDVPEARQRVFQSHACALDEVKKGGGVGLALGYAISHDLSTGRLLVPSGPPVRTGGSWSATALTDRDEAGPAAEFIRFATTPRATQAMLRGSGVHRGRFRSGVHVTLWNHTAPRLPAP